MQDFLKNLCVCSHLAQVHILLKGNCAMCPTSRNNIATCRKYRNVLTHKVRYRNILTKVNGKWEGL